MSARTAVKVLSRAKTFDQARAFATASRCLAQVANNPASPTPGENSSAVSPNYQQKSSLTSPLSPSARPAKKHNALTVAIVKGIARLMGYNSTTTTAIRVTSDLYDRCAAQADKEADFWYGACRLPRTYQTWFQITTLYVHLLIARFRALPTSKISTNYSQELINHFYIDAESRMRVRFGVQTSRLVKGYMKEMHTQQRGAILSYDEALAVSVRSDVPRELHGDADAILATALWRNIWGAGGWGEGVGGVKRKVKGVDKPDDEKSKSVAPTNLEEEEAGPELAHDLGIETTGQGAYAIAAAQAKAEAKGQPAMEIKQEDLLQAQDLEFAVSLERVVNLYRRESSRLAALSDDEVQAGFTLGPAPAKGADSSSTTASQARYSIGSFGKI